MKGSPERNRASRGLGLGVVLQCRLRHMAIKNGRGEILYSLPMNKSNPADSRDFAWDCYRILHRE